MQASQGGEDDPILYTIAVNDVATASVVAMSVIAALNARERTGEGQDIKTSLLAQSLLFQLGEMVTYDGRPPNDVGAVDCIGLRALHRYYECADGWIGLVADSDAAAAGLAQVLGVDLGPAPLLAPRDGEVADRIAAALAGRDRGPTLEALVAAGVAAAPVMRSAETLEDAWLAENRYLDHWEHPRLGPMITVRGYADFDRTPGGFVLPTPDLGEHSAQVLADWGIAPERIEGLLATGAVFASDGLGGIAQTPQAAAPA
jgi:crotonobetainyl-CoA:carnitine CoA-transferase CaiB-like acyl-CoA transferase